MSSDGLAIRVENVSKHYLLFDRPENRLKQSLVPRVQRLLGRPPTQYFRPFAALEGVSFEVRRGETVGIIGRNGSGKSTLLQVICGTLHPTHGSVEVNGRVTALLELGSGFNPEFTGRQNVYLNGGILGLAPEEVDAHFDAIVDFADIGAFVDQPVKTYSSGMYVRLAFAVSACLDPDILIIDEALAVGDVKFQAKCFRRLEELVAKGTSILFVSHSTDQVTRHCDRAILLENGRVHMIGAPKDVTNRYLDLLFGAERKRAPAPTTVAGLPLEIKLDPSAFEQRPGYNPSEYRWGNREAEIVDVMVTTDGTSHTTRLATGTRVAVVIRAKFNSDVTVPIFGLTIKTPDGVTVYGCNSRDCAGGPVVHAAKAGETLTVTYTFDQKLGAGEYLMALGIAEERNGEVVPLDRRYDSLHLTVTNALSRSYGFVDLNMAVDVR